MVSPVPTKNIAATDQFCNIFLICLDHLPIRYRRLDLGYLAVVQGKTGQQFHKEKPGSLIRPEKS